MFKAKIEQQFGLSHLVTYLKLIVVVAIHMFVMHVHVYSD